MLAAQIICKCCSVVTLHRKLTYHIINIFVKRHRQSYRGAGKFTRNFNSRFHLLTANDYVNGAGYVLLFSF